MSPPPGKRTKLCGHNGETTGLGTHTWAERSGNTYQDASTVYFLFFSVNTHTHTPQSLSGWWEGPQRQVTGRIRGQEYREGIEEGQARDGGLVLLVTTAFVSRVLEAPHLEGKKVARFVGTAAGLWRFNPSNERSV